MYSLKNPAIKLKNKNDEIVVEATVTVAKDDANGKLEAFISDANNNKFSKSIKRIEYDHIPYQFILSDAEAGLVNVDLKKAGTNIGYIAGAGDDVPAL